MGSQILIVGANGFLGEALARRLLSAGHALSGTRLPGTRGPDIPPLSVTERPIDQSPDLTALLASQNLVINCAGQMRGDRQADYFKANVRVPETLAWHLQKIPKPPILVHFSSVAAIGPSAPGQESDEEAVCRPVSLYGKTKQAGEHALLKAREQMPKIPLLILRPPSLFGPGDPCFFDLFAWARRGVFPRLCTRHKSFNLLYINDLTEMVCHLVQQIAETGVIPGPILHFGFSGKLTDEDLCRFLGDFAGQRLSPAFLGRGASRLLARLDCLSGRLRGCPALFSPSKVEEMSHPDWLQSFHRFHTLFPKLHPTPFGEALAKTGNWYKSQGWL